MKKLLSQIRITEVGDTSHRLVSLYKSTATLKDEAFLKPLFVEMEEKANALEMVPSEYWIGYSKATKPFLWIP